MSVPYIPGFWDQIKGDVLPAANQVMQRINPDFFANKKLQEMLQQNPMALEQLANMDDAQRNVFAQTMGFKKTNPIKDLPVGAQRQRREEDNAYAQKLTPAAKDEMMANRLGTKSQSALFREDKEFDWKSQINDIAIPTMKIDSESKAILLSQQKRAAETLNKAYEKYGGQLDFNLMFKAMDNPQLMDEQVQGMMQVASNDPGLMNALQYTFDLKKMRETQRHNFSLRSLGQQDDTDRLMLNTLGQVRRAYTDAANRANKVLSDGKMSGLSIEMTLEDPLRRQLYQDALAERDTYKIQFDEMQGWARNFAKRNGAETGVLAPLPEMGGGPPKAETDEERMARFLNKHGGR